MLYVKVRKANNHVLGSGRSPKGKPANDDEFAYVEVTEAELQAYEGVRRQRREDLKSEAPVVIGGSRGARTFTLSADPRLRLKVEGSLGGPRGSAIRLRFTAINDAGKTRDAFSRDADLHFPAGALGNLPRLLRVSFVEGVGEKEITLHDSGVFVIDEGRGFRMDRASTLKVWE